MKNFKIILISTAILALLTLFSCEKVCEHEYETTSQGQKCDAEVTNSKICSKCGDASYTTLPPTGHTFKETVTPADCTEGGYTEYSCSCGFSYKSEFTSPKGHDFREIVSNPSCDAIGFTTFVCRACDYTYKGDYIDSLGHTLESVTTNADCEKEGFTTYSCDKCDFTYVSDHVEPLGHEYESTKTEPRCTDAGFTTHSCKNCDYSYDSDFTEPTGHTFTSEIKSSADCTKKGETVYSCQCGYSYSEIVAPAGHDFIKNTISPTVSDMGYTEFSCACGFNYKGNYRFYSDILDNAYAGNDKVVARGIDISRWNHTVDKNGNFEPLDWEAIKAAGVDYVILKIGSTVRDGGELGGVEPTFEMDYAGAKAAGLDVGVYFFTYSTSVSQIRQDAENVLEWLEGKQFEYPIYLDVEDTKDGSYKPSEIASPILTEMCLTFFSALQKEGYYTGLYVNNKFLFNVMQTENMIDLFEIWYARYPSSDSVVWDSEDLESYVWNIEKYGEHLGMWQFSQTGELSPISTEVDFNCAYKDYPSLIKNNGFNNYSLPDEFPEEESETEDISENTEIISMN